MDPNGAPRSDTSSLVTTNRLPTFRSKKVVPNPGQIETMANGYRPIASGRSSPTPSLDSITMAHSTPCQQEKTGFLSKGFPHISPDYRDMESNLFLISMLLNGSPLCVKYDVTFATHLSNASVALVSYAMKDISCFNEIETTGKRTVLPVQPWVLWAFVMQELCKTIVLLLSRNPSEVLLTSVHPLQSVDSTLLEWEHHPSYMKWTSTHLPTSPPIDILSLLEGYATSLKAAMGLLMISAARIFGPVSRTCGDFNILGYQDHDQPADTPRNLYFGDPNVTVKNSPGIFIYEAGINVIEICKALEAHKYSQMADELKDLAAEALFSSMTHMYPEKMQADLIAIEERIIPPLEKHHSLRATASEFHPNRTQPLKGTPISLGSKPMASPPTLPGMRHALPSDSGQTPSLAIRPGNANQTPQSTRVPTDHEVVPPTASHPPVRPQENPVIYQGIQVYTSPASSTLVLPQFGSYNTPTIGSGMDPASPVALLPELQTPRTIGTQSIPPTSPTFRPGFQITQTANGYLIPSIEDSVLQAYQAAIAHSEEQLFLECRRTAQRLLGLPVSPKIPPPLSFRSPPTFWYYTPALFSSGPVSAFQNPQAGLPGHSLPSPTQQGHVLQNPPEYDADQYIQTLSDLANSSPQTLNPPSSIPADSHTYSDTEFPDPQLSSQPLPTPEIQYPEPTRSTHPAASQSPTSDYNLEPPQHPTRRQRRPKRFDSETRAQGRPLAPHLDDYIGYPSRRSNR